MQSHDDRDARDRWLESLQAKADRMRSEGLSEITGGKPGEGALGEWTVGNMVVRELPADEHGILRISVGGGPTPVPTDYCVYRGDRAECRRLLSAAVRALASLG